MAGGASCSIAITDTYANKSSVKIFIANELFIACESEKVSMETESIMYIIASLICFYYYDNTFN